MKKHFLSDMIFFVSLIAFIIVICGHSVAGENLSICLGPEAEIVSIVIAWLADNKTTYAGTQSEHLKSTDRGKIWSIMKKR